MKKESYEIGEPVKVGMETKLIWSDSKGKEDDEDVHDEDNHGENDERRVVGINDTRAWGGRQRRTSRYLSDYVTGNEPLEEDELNMVETNHHDPITYEEAIKNKKMESRYGCKNRSNRDEPHMGSSYATK